MPLQSFSIQYWIAWLIFWCFFSDFSFNMQSLADWCFWVKEISSLMTILIFILAIFIFCNLLIRTKSIIFDYLINIQVSCVRIISELNWSYNINASLSLFIVWLFFSNKTNKETWFWQKILCGYGHNMSLKFYLSFFLSWR